jgi:hypothetical protein
VCDLLLSLGLASIPWQVEEICWHAAQLEVSESLTKQADVGKCYDTKRLPEY